MIEPMHQPSKGAKYSLYYITAGSLVIIWSAIWYYWLRENAPNSTGPFYVCTGLFLSGAAVLIIGVLVGRIGKEGKNADVPVTQVPVQPGTPVGVQNASGTPVAAPTVPVAVNGAMPPQQIQRVS